MPCQRSAVGGAGFFRPVSSASRSGESACDALSLGLFAVGAAAGGAPDALAVLTGDVLIGTVTACSSCNSCWRALVTSRRAGGGWGWGRLTRRRLDMLYFGTSNAHSANLRGGGPSAGHAAPAMRTVGLVASVHESASRHNGVRSKWVGVPEKRPLKTLERVLSKAGLGSRTEARRWIHAGRVHVNGREVQNPDTWVDMVRDRVIVDGRPLQVQQRLYVLLYKPTGYLTTYKDPDGRRTVYDLTADISTFLSPVGRLDLDTSGLIVMTNDTQLAERITNPNSHVPKTYLVKSSTVLTDDQLQALRDGIALADGPTRPATVTRLRDSAKYTHLEITISEGRNRQVRRMVEALGAHVLKLVRVQIGTIRIDTLPIGKWRHLTPAEIESLRGWTPA